MTVVIISLIASFAAIGWIAVFVFYYLLERQDISASINYAKKGLLFGLAALFPIMGVLLLGLVDSVETFKQKWRKWWNSRQFILLENLEKEILKDMEDTLDKRLTELHTHLLQAPNPSKPLDYEVEHIKSYIRDIRSKESEMIKKKAIRDFLLGILVQAAFWVGFLIWGGSFYLLRDVT